MGKLDRCYNIADLREVALRRLPRGVFEYVDRGAEDEIAVAHNRRIYAETKLLNRTLVDISDVRLETDLLGGASAMPLAIAPTGAAGLCWFEGELAIAKAAARAGIPFALATPSNTAMEKIADEAGGQLWFQLYMWRDKELSVELVHDQEIKDAITKGVRPDGSRLLNFMPFAAFAGMRPADLDAIVAYLRTLKPAKS